MHLEMTILYMFWVLSVLSLWFIPKDKQRNAHVAFLFKQVLTWFLGLIVAKYGLIEYPVGIFSEVSKGSFTFEFMIYPAICAFFNVHYPVSSSRIKILYHYLIYTSGITVIEVILEQYTQLIKYIHWSWYWTWLSLFVTFWLSRLYYCWFFRNEQ